MPIYEYECSNCKFYVEALQKISESPLRQCPSCKKQTLKRLVSAPNFRLKGGGWYETDFKSDKEGQRNLAQGEEAEAAPADKPAEDKAKPAEADKAADKKPAAAPGRKAAAKAKKTSRPAAKSKAKANAKPKAGKRRR
jgi:putative FmdB family regulatory protein